MSTLRAGGKELKQLGKPFAMIINSANPASDKSIALAYELEAKYKVPVALVSCLDLDAEDIRHILELVLHEFPVTEISVKLPEWTAALDDNHRIRASLLEAVKKCAGWVSKTGDIVDAFHDLNDNEYVKSAEVQHINLGNGKAVVAVALKDGLYYDIVSELTGFDISGEEDLIRHLRDFATMKSEYERVADALATAQEKGYGIVMPTIEDLRLENPEIVKQAGGYGVRLRASAQSIHMIRANIEAEINPIVGTEQIRGPCQIHAARV